MKLKSLLTKTLITSIVIAAPSISIAGETNLKVAVIKDAAENKHIINGEYQEVIANLENTVSEQRNFEESTTLCVAYLKTSNLIKSEAACSAAIKRSKSLDASSKKVRYLKSVSYNNRAVARYLKNDITGAMSDLASASSINNNELVKANLTFMNSKIDFTNDTQTATYAD